jgi:RNA polymerase sigma-70 factor (ECF subfamily)
MPEEGPETTIRDFLANGPEAIARLAGWARSVARHRAWGCEAPEDVVQATLMALVTNFREGRFAGGNLEAYVRRIAKNHCLDCYRRDRVRQAHLTDLRRQDPPRLVGSLGLDPGLRVDLHRVFDLMEAACRELVLLAYFLGYSRKEIAELQRISETLVKVRLHRCLERVRARLGPKVAGGRIP